MIENMVPIKDARDILFANLEVKNATYIFERMLNRSVIVSYRKIVAEKHIKDGRQVIT